MLGKRSLKRLEEALNLKPKEHIIPIMAVCFDKEKKKFRYRGIYYETMDELRKANNASMRGDPIIWDCSFEHKQDYDV